MSDLQPGLFYRRTDGVEVAHSDEGDTQWLVTFKPDGQVMLVQYESGRIDASYAPMDVATATVALAAISQGFEPPRGLRHQEKPVR